MTQSNVEEAGYWVTVVAVSNRTLSDTKLHLQSIIRVASDCNFGRVQICSIIAKGASRSDDFVKTFGPLLDEVTFVSETKPGIYPAMNAGLDAALGSFVIFINCGDTLLSLPDNLMEGKTNCFPVRYKTSGSVRYPDDPAYLFPHHQGTFYPRDVYTKWLYDERLKLAGDLDYFLRLCPALVVGSRYPVVAEFELGGASMDPLNRLQRIKERYYVLIKRRKLVKGLIIDCANWLRQKGLMRNG